jgi:hypothetical protein
MPLPAWFLSFITSSTSSPFAIFVFSQIDLSSVFEKTILGVAVYLSPPSYSGSSGFVILIFAFFYFLKLFVVGLSVF